MYGGGWGKGGGFTRAGESDIKQRYVIEELPVGGEAKLIHKYVCDFSDYDCFLVKKAPMVVNRFEVVLCDNNNTIGGEVAYVKIFRDGDLMYAGGNALLLDFKWENEGYAEPPPKIFTETLTINKR